MSDNVVAIKEALIDDKHHSMREREKERALSVRTFSNMIYKYKYSIDIYKYQYYITNIKCLAINCGGIDSFA